MGFSCPVCEDPQADAVHLANHLAITAMTRGGDHEAWLDDNVPDWEELGETGLANVVSEFATSTEYPTVFEDTTGQHPGVRRSQEHADHSHDQTPSTQEQTESGTDRSGADASDSEPQDQVGKSPTTEQSIPSGIDEETRQVMQEALELERQYRSGEGSEESGDENRESESTGEQ